MRARQNEAKNVNPFKESQHEREAEVEEKVAKTANKTRPKPVVRLSAKYSEQAVAAHHKPVRASNATRQECAQNLFAGAATERPNAFLQLPRPSHRRLLRRHLWEAVVGRCVGASASLLFARTSVARDGIRPILIATAGFAARRFTYRFHRGSRFFNNFEKSQLR